MINKEALQKRLQRLEKRKAELVAKHTDNETSVYNYWGGWDMGYLKGAISVIEDILDDLTDQTP